MPGQDVEDWVEVAFDVILSSKILEHRGIDNSTRGKEGDFFFPVRRLKVLITQRCLLAAVLCKTVATSEIHELEFLCIGQSLARRSQSGKLS